MFPLLLLSAVAATFAPEPALRPTMMYRPFWVAWVDDDIVRLEDKLTRSGGGDCLSREQHDALQRRIDEMRRLVAWYK